MHLSASKLQLQFAVLLLFLNLGCATYTEKSKAMRSNFRNGNYQQALTALEDSSIKTENRNQLLYLMEKASILQKLKRNSEARQLWMNADKLSDRLYTQSITNTASTYIINESMQEYAGEAYEKVAINTMLALSFLEEQDYEGARIEASRINTKLKRITSGWGKKHNTYQTDPFAQFLSAIIYEKQKMYDSAYIDYNRAYQKFKDPSHRVFYTGPIPKSLVYALYPLAKNSKNTPLVKELEQTYPDLKDSIKRNQNTAQLIVIHEIGQIAIKRSKDFFIPMNEQMVRISFPYVEYSSLFHQGKIGLKINDEMHIAENVSNLSSIAHHVLEEKRQRLILKGIARNVVKYQVVESVKNKFGGVAGLLANVVTAATESADTRCWQTLPHQIYVSRVFLKPGDYKIQIFNNNRTNQTLDLKLKPGEINIIRDYPGV